MKRLTITGALLLTIAVAGCETRDATPSNANVKGAVSNQAAGPDGNSNGNAPRQAAPEAAPEVATTAPPPLVGTYLLTEIRDKGVVNLVPDRTTIISFTADGGYSRVAKKGTFTYHSDAGNYQLEGDRFILLISMSQSKMFNPPRRVTHTYSLSADGKELLLTSAKGSTALWRRVEGGLAAKQ
jgi:hypothetical protein